MDIRDSSVGEYVDPGNPHATEGPPVSMLPARWTLPHRRFLDSSMLQFMWVSGAEYGPAAASEHEVDDETLHGPGTCAGEGNAMVVRLILVTSL